MFGKKRFLLPILSGLFSLAVLLPGGSAAGTTTLPGDSTPAQVTQTTGTVQAVLF